MREKEQQIEVLCKLQDAQREIAIALSKQANVMFELIMQMKEEQDITLHQTHLKLTKTISKNFSKMEELG